MRDFILVIFRLLAEIVKIKQHLKEWSKVGLDLALENW